MSKDYGDLKIKLAFGCGYSNAIQEDQEPLCDFWTEDEWNAMTKPEQDRWLYNFWLDWKAQYEDGGAWVE